MQLFWRRMIAPNQGNSIFLTKQYVCVYFFLELAALKSLFTADFIASRLRLTVHTARRVTVYKRRKFKFNFTSSASVPGILPRFFPNNFFPYRQPLVSNIVWFNLLEFRGKAADTSATGDRVQFRHFRSHEAKEAVQEEETRRIRTPGILFFV